MPPTAQLCPARATLCPELIAELACGAQDQDQFEHDVLTELNRHIGFDIAFFVRPDGVSDVSPGLDRNVLSSALPQWQAMAGEIDVLGRAASERGGVIVDRDLFGVQLERRTYYDVFMRPHAGHCTLMGFLAPRGVPLAEVILGRSGRSRRFSAEESGVLRRLVPTLSLAAASFRIAGDAPCPAMPVQQLAPRGAPGKARPSAIDAELSPRERDVLGYLGLGYTNAQIALALGTKERTVRNQLSEAYRKLGVATRAEAVGVLFAAR